MSATNSIAVVRVTSFHSRICNCDTPLRALHRSPSILIVRFQSIHIFVQQRIRSDRILSEDLTEDEVLLMNGSEDE
jgi:hypothetical protein